MLRTATQIIFPWSLKTLNWRSESVISIPIFLGGLCLSSSGQPWSTLLGRWVRNEIQSSIDKADTFLAGRYNITSGATWDVRWWSLEKFAPRSSGGISFPFPPLQLLIFIPDTRRRRINDMSKLQTCLSDLQWYPKHGTNGLTISFICVVNLQNPVSC